MFLERDEMHPRTWGRSDDPYGAGIPGTRVNDPTNVHRRRETADDEIVRDMDDIIYPLNGQAQYERGRIEEREENERRSQLFQRTRSAVVAAARNYPDNYQQSVISINSSG